MLGSQGFLDCAEASRSGCIEGVVAVDPSHRLTEIVAEKRRQLRMVHLCGRGGEREALAALAAEGRPTEQDALAHSISDEILGKARFLLCSAATGSLSLDLAPNDEDICQGVVSHTRDAIDASDGANRVAAVADAERSPSDPVSSSFEDAGVPPRTASVARHGRSGDANRRLPGDYNEGRRRRRNRWRHEPSIGS